MSKRRRKKELMPLKDLPAEAGLAPEEEAAFRLEAAPLYPVMDLVTDGDKIDATYMVAGLSGYFIAVRVSRGYIRLELWKGEPGERAELLRGGSAALMAGRTSFPNHADSFREAAKIARDWCKAYEDGDRDRQDSGPSGGVA